MNTRKYISARMQALHNHLYKKYSAQNGTWYQTHPSSIIKLLLAVAAGLQFLCWQDIQFLQRLTNIHTIATTACSNVDPHKNSLFYVNREVFSAQTNSYNCTRRYIDAHALINFAYNCRVILSENLSAPNYMSRKSIASKINIIFFESEADAGVNDRVFGFTRSLIPQLNFSRFDISKFAKLLLKPRCKKVTRQILHVYYRPYSFFKSCHQKVI